MATPTLPGGPAAAVSLSCCSCHARRHRNSLATLPLLLRFPLAVQSSQVLSSSAWAPPGDPEFRPTLADLLVSDTKRVGPANPDGRTDI